MKLEFTKALRSPRPPYLPQALQSRISDIVQVRMTVQDGNIIDVGSLRASDIGECCRTMGAIKLEVYPTTNGTFSLPFHFSRIDDLVSASKGLVATTDCCSPKCRMMANSDLVRISAFRRSANVNSVDCLTPASLSGTTFFMVIPCHQRISLSQKAIRMVRRTQFFH
jgi:hypothetical protein